MSNHNTAVLSSGKSIPTQLQGTSGKFIVILKRTRVDDKFNPSIISHSWWQIVKAVPGTWLTAVAKYDMKWANKDLHRVYFDEWVQKCEPGSDDTKADYTFSETFAPGGRWEDGINSPPNDKKGDEAFRDYQVEVGSYWAFKIKEELYIKPGLEGDKVLRRKKKMFDILFEEAFTLQDKKYLLDELKRLENTAKKIENTKMSEKEKLEEVKNFLEELKEKIKNKVGNKEAVEIIESYFRYAERSLKKSIGLKESMEGRVVKELEYVKFRALEYDAKHEGDQKVEEIQKGTDKEDQWKKTPPLLPRKVPERKILLEQPSTSPGTPSPSITAPSGTSPNV